MDFHENHQNSPKLTQTHENHHNTWIFTKIIKTHPNSRKPPKHMEFHENHPNTRKPTKNTWELTNPRKRTEFHENRPNTRKSTKTHGSSRIHGAGGGPPPCCTQPCACPCAHVPRPTIGDAIHRDDSTSQQTHLPAYLPTYHQQTPCFPVPDRRPILFLTSHREIPTSHAYSPFGVGSLRVIVISITAVHFKVFVWRRPLAGIGMFFYVPDFAGSVPDFAGLPFQFRPIRE